MTREPKARQDEPQGQDQSAYVRAQNEDDDGYDPYSDRPADRDPLFEEDPWR